MLRQKPKASMLEVFRFTFEPRRHVLKCALDIELMTSRLVAGLARRNDVGFRGLSAACKRRQMIHRQLRFRKLLTAVMTKPRADLILPPLRFAQLARLGSFTFDMGLIGHSVRTYHEFAQEGTTAP